MRWNMNNNSYALCLNIADHWELVGNLYLLILNGNKKENAILRPLSNGNGRWNS